VSAQDGAGLIIGLVLLGYLFYALIKPDRF
jgi:K+-transporting ATPase KdpF subunit